MMVPCKSCPWRTSTRTADIPGGGMDQVRGPLADGPRPQHIMACHLTTDEAPRACAGWVTQVAVPAACASGEQAIPMRMLLFTGRVDVTEYSNGGAELYADMSTMLAAHRRGVR